MVLLATRLERHALLAASLALPPPNPTPDVQLAIMEQAVEVVDELVDLSDDFVLHISLAHPLVTLLVHDLDLVLHKHTCGGAWSCHTCGELARPVLAGFRGKGLPEQRTIGWQPWAQSSCWGKLLWNRHVALHSLRAARRAAAPAPAGSLAAAVLCQLRLWLHPCARTAGVRASEGCRPARLVR